MSSDFIFSIALFCLGFLLLAVELFLIPGLGIVGPIGLVVLAGGVVYAWTTLGSVWGLAGLGLSLLISVLGLWLFPKSKTAKRLILDNPQKGNTAANTDFGYLIGKQGRALTPLHPSGSGEFDDERFDIITDGVYLEAGQEIRVISAQGARIVVEAVED
ncbi:MAG: hypothetical protein IPJ88_08290 [Myxococcales bacterium]|nr:MAG: hypothetical protein IPJ88_08290 [Myxococcales bacterium]